MLLYSGIWLRFSWEVVSIYRSRRISGSGDTVNKYVICGYVVGIGEYMVVYICTRDEAETFRWGI